jgi:peptide/nickel transport system permease protein
MCWEDGALVNLILSRLSSSFIALIGAAFFAFVALRLAPGDAARLTLGAFATDEALAALRSEMGLDRSAPEQFLIYLWDFFTGNWGRSYSLGEPVRSLLANRFPAKL